MKKFLVTLLALSMMFAMAVPAYAATNILYTDDLDLTNNTATNDVYANFTVTDASGYDTKVYRVLVGWGDAVDEDDDYVNDNRDWGYFKGNVTAVYKWNTDELRYKAESKVLDENDFMGSMPFDIFVFNLSNAPVEAQLTYAAKEIETDTPLSTVSDWGSVQARTDYSNSKDFLDESSIGAENPFAVIASCEDTDNPHTAQGKVQGCVFSAVIIDMTEAGKNKAIADSNTAGTARTVLGTFTVTISPPVG